MDKQTFWGLIRLMAIFAIVSVLVKYL